jgi:hypothetical protein
LFGHAFQLGARCLAGEQDNTVKAGDDNVRAFVEVRVGFGYVDRDLGFDQGIVDFATKRPGAAIVFDRCIASCGQDRTASAEAKAQCQSQ